MGISGGNIRDADKGAFFFEHDDEVRQVLCCTTEKKQTAFC